MKNAMKVLNLLLALHGGTDTLTQLLLDIDGLMKFFTQSQISSSFRVQFTEHKHFSASIEFVESFRSRFGSGRHILIL